MPKDSLSTRKRLTTSWSHHSSPSLFERVHGSAFGIMGKWVANHARAIWSAVEMLRWLGEKDAADKLMENVKGYAKRRVDP